MTNFLSSWLLSIIGIVFIGVLSDAIVTNTKMKKTVKTIVSIFIILTILKPLSIFDIKKLNIFNSTSFATDNTFIETYEDVKIEKLKTDIKNSLKENGYDSIEISIELEKNKKINTIYVDLGRLVLIDKSLNINKYTNIIAIIKQFVDIDREHIVFYE